MGQEGSTMTGASTHPDESTRKARTANGLSSTHSHKGLIGKFQNLFKSSMSSSTSTLKHTKTSAGGSSSAAAHTEIPILTTTTSNQHGASHSSQPPAVIDVHTASQPSSKSTNVELINYQKRRFDSPTYNNYETK
jgi:hypothetical protein